MDSKGAIIGSRECSVNTNASSIFYAAHAQPTGYVYCIGSGILQGGEIG